MSEPCADSGIGQSGNQRSVTTWDMKYLIHSHEKLMDFYHMKGMQARNRADQIRFFELRDYHFEVATRFSKEYRR
jgi:hypothetical protein